MTLQTPNDNANHMAESTKIDFSEGKMVFSQKAEDQSRNREPKETMVEVTLVESEGSLRRMFGSLI